MLPSCARARTCGVACGVANGHRDLLTLNSTLGWWIVPGLVVGLTLGMTASAAASPRGKGSKEAQAKRLVEEALRKEIDGYEGDRAALLGEARGLAKQLPAAHWHAGEIRRGRHQWVSVDEAVERAQNNRLLKWYLRERRESANTVEGHLQLANWCARHKLPDQERAHLTRVVELSPDHAEARDRLGFVNVEGVWLARAEREAAMERAELAERDLAAWQPRLEALVKELHSKNERKRQSARSAIEAIRDPAAIGAMELAAASSELEVARLFLARLETMSAHEASAALTRLAVFAESEDIRTEAAMKLSSRKVEEYAPLLLAELKTPIQSRAEVFRAPDGRLVNRMIYFREGQQNREVALVDTSYGRIGTGRLPSGAVSRARADAEETAAELNALSAAENARMKSLNDQLCATLATATGRDLGTEPTAWWSWWNEHNELFVAGEKPLVGRRITREVDVTPSGSEGSDSTGGGGGGGGGGGTRDCLLAGTPVQTELGPVAIERIAVGDRVLSQHPETGELAFQPVLATTVRPRSALVKLTLSGDQIVASGGHPFWISGRGWVKAREVQPGDRLHTPTGFMEVEAVAMQSPQVTHNLVVADFHTYFVGKHRILSHDNTLRANTNARVPGLVEVE